MDPSPSIDPTANTTSDAATALSNSVVTSEDIARLAYSFWEARGYQGGSPEEDWLRAEQELNRMVTTASV